MLTPIWNNLVEFQKLAGSFDQASIGQNHNLQWILNRSDRWPNSVFGTPTCNEIEELTQLMDNRELPSYLITPTATIKDHRPTFDQFKLKEILRWEGMLLKPLDFCQNHKKIDGFHLQTVNNQLTLQNWVDVVKPVMLPNKTISSAILNGLLNDKNTFLLVGYWNEKPITSGLAFLNDGVSGLYFIATLPEYQGKGFASLLVSSLIEESFRRGAKEIVLHSSVAGRKLYAKLGFQPKGEISTFWKLGNF